MTKQNNRVKRLVKFKRILKQAFALILLLLLTIVIYLCTAGFPNKLVSEICRKINTGNFVLNTSSMKLDLHNGIVAKNVNLYKKGIVGPSIINAERIIFSPNLRDLFKKKLTLRKIEIINGVIRPTMTQTPNIFQSSDPDIKMITRLELYDCIVQGMRIESLSCKINIDTPRLRLEKIIAMIGPEGTTGPVSGNVTYNINTSVIKGEGESRIDPAFANPIFEEWRLKGLIKIINSFSFPRKAPNCELSFSKLCKTNGFFNLNGRVMLEDCSFNNVPMSRADGHINVDISETNASMRIDHLFVFREDGHANGEMDINFRKKTIGFNGESAMNPVSLANMIGVIPTNIINTFHFNGPTRMTGYGTIYVTNRNLTDITLSMQSKGFGVDKFNTDTCSLTLKSSGRTNDIINIKGTIYDGSFWGSAQIILPEKTKTNVYYSAKAELRDATIKEMLANRLENKNQTLNGKLFGNVDIKGRTGEGWKHALTGKGAMKIKDGHIFTLPIFGGFTAIMTKIIPGLNFIISQNDARAEFKIQNGRVYSEEIYIAGDILSLSAKGYYSFDNDLNFKAQSRFMNNKNVLSKLVNIITRPLTTLLEFRLRGPIKDPEWYPINFSRELLRKLGLASKED